MTKQDIKDFADLFGVRVKIEEAPTNSISSIKTMYIAVVGSKADRAAFIEVVTEHKPAYTIIFFTEHSRFMAWLRGV